MATILRRGKKRIITNSGIVQVDLNSDRILVYDREKYRFLAGDKPDETVKVDISKEGVNVLDT